MSDKQSGVGVDGDTHACSTQLASSSALEQGGRTNLHSAAVNEKGGSIPPLPNSYILCLECGKYPADYPSKYCQGCAAYKEHQQ